MLRDKTQLPYLHNGILICRGVKWNYATTPLCPAPSTMGRAQLMWATIINAYLPARKRSLSSHGTPTQAACTDQDTSSMLMDMAQPLCRTERTQSNRWGFLSRGNWVALSEPLADLGPQSPHPQMRGQSQSDCVSWRARGLLKSVRSPFQKGRDWGAGLEGMPCNIRSKCGRSKPRCCYK